MSDDRIVTVLCAGCKGYEGAGYSRRIGQGQVKSLLRIVAADLVIASFGSSAILAGEPGAAISPSGGEIPEDYLFEAAGAGGKPKGVRLSELFGPGKDTLAIYSLCSDRRGSGRVRAARTSSMVWTVPRGTSSSASTSLSSPSRRCRVSFPSPRSVAGTGCSSCPRLATPSTTTTTVTRRASFQRYGSNKTSRRRGMGHADPECVPPWP